MGVAVVLAWGLSECLVLCVFIVYRTRPTIHSVFSAHSCKHPEHPIPSTTGPSSPSLPSEERFGASGGQCKRTHLRHETSGGVRIPR